MSNRVNHQRVFLLSSKPWRENSLWIEVFSQDYGRVALLARSARARGSELRGVLLPFMPFSASWFGKEELKTLHRAEWLGGWRSAQGQALFSALYVNELIYKLTAREDPQPPIFSALENVMHAICHSSQHLAALRHFEWQLFHHLGLLPSFQHDDNNHPIESSENYLISPDQAIQKLPANAPILLPHQIQVKGSVLADIQTGQFQSPENLQQARQLMRIFVDFHLGQNVTSRAILQNLQTLSQTMSEKMRAA